MFSSLNKISFSAFRTDQFLMACCFVFSVLCGQVQAADAWTEAFFRGTPDNFVGTSLTKNAATGLWETQQNFSGIANPRFKISRSVTNWNEAYPPQDYLITGGDGDYKITFNDASKDIVATKLPVIISFNSICFDNATNFAAPYIYFWNPTPSSTLTILPAWPGKAMTKRGNYFCYDFSTTLTSSGAMPASLNVIFSNNGSNQTTNLTYANGAGCHEKGVWKTLQQCGFVLTPSGPWTEAFFRGTSTNFVGAAMTKNTATGLWETQQNFSGVANPRFKISHFVNDWSEAYPVADWLVTTGDGDYKITFNDASKAIAVSKIPPIISANNICFNNPNNFATPTLYFWEPVPAGSMDPLPAWPGKVMAKRGNYFCYDFSPLLTAGVMPSGLNVIFNNNGASQTATLNFSGSGCYENGVWKTLQQCSFVIVDTGSSKSSSSSKPSSSSSSSSSSKPSSSSSSSKSSSSSSSVNVFKRPLLATPLKFPISGTVSEGKYRFVPAFPNLNAKFPSPVLVLADGLNDLMYVVDKEGKISVFPNRENVAVAEVRTLLNITNVVRNSHEMGLLGMAFDPNYATNGFIYVYYVFGTNDNEPKLGEISGDTILERWTVNDPRNPTAVLPESKVDILRVEQVGPDHKGGMMQFHPADGTFYMSVGDGGYANSALPLVPADPSDNRVNNSAQDTNTLRGKMIRIKMLETAGADGKFYEIPSDNPFVGRAGFRGEIWSYGHRNPWRWSFDKVAPHTLWEAEVGQQGNPTFEEVNIIEKGKNYGWPVCEGLVNRGRLGGNPNKNCAVDYAVPAEGYDQKATQSIIGGVVYRGNALPALKGSFIFGDYNTRRIWSVAAGQAKATLSTAFPTNIASFGTDLSGDTLFVTSYCGQKFCDQSSIYKVLDDNAIKAIIPPKLSGTGLFADLKSQVPTVGVIEYGVNTQGWFDGANARHFMAVPNDQTIDFDVTATWNFPIGSVLVKHKTIATAGNPTKPFTTSVLFRQDNGNWQAANYRWNAEGTDADFVTVSERVQDGGTPNRERLVEDSTGCVSCHKGTGSTNPIGIHTRQLNRNFNFSSLVFNQLDMFNRYGLFSSSINNAASYDHFVAPDDITAGVNLRARSYLHSNCAHCHFNKESIYDLRFDTPFARTFLVEPGLIAFDHANSLIYIKQRTDDNRMPRGTSYTNPAASALFAEWIDAVGAVQTGVNLRTTQTQVDIGKSIILSLDEQYNNDFVKTTTKAITWTSSNSSILSVSGLSNNNITLVSNTAGVVTITGSVNGFSSSQKITINKPTKDVVIAAIQVSPSTLTLSGTQQLVAFGRLSDGKNASLFGQVSWRMASGSAVASVSSTGLLTRLTNGTAVVEASYKEFKATSSITTTTPGILLRYKNTLNWSDVKVHLWTVVNGVAVPVKPWPGVSMTKGADNVWTYWVDLPLLQNGKINVIFNNGAGDQTGDILGVTESSSFEGKSVIATPLNAKAILSVNNGTITGNGTDNKFQAGQIVTLTADNPPSGSVFAGWSSGSLPYIVGDASKPIVQIVMPDSGITLDAIFVLAEDKHLNGRQLYAAMCTGCHGTNGTDGLNKPVEKGRTLEWLTAKIRDTMPQQNPSLCVGSTPGTCAYDIANMIVNDAWLAPATCTGSNCAANKSIDARNLRLLTKEEYLNSVNDIFAMNFPSSLMLTIKADGTSRNFNTASYLRIDSDRNEDYQKLAIEIAKKIFDVKTLFTLTSGCGNDKNCAVSQLGKRMFRRALTNAEATKYANLYEVADGGKALVQALLMSPKFLYRSEMGVKDSVTGLFRLTNSEIATLLSYSFLVTTPNDALLAAAGSSNFNIETEVRKMLADPRAEKGLRRFAQGWFIYDKYGFAAIPNLTMTDFFKEETIKFVVENIKGNAPVNTLLNANYTYANKTLAQYYKLPSVPATDSSWEKIFYAANDVRSGTGVLGHASFLASRVSSNVNPSPIKRGLFVRDVLLCQKFNSPPAANFSPKHEADDTNRDAISRHTSDPSCRGCHQFIDGVGFGFEGLGSDALPRTKETTLSGLVKEVIHSGSITSIFNTPETLLIEGSREDRYNTVNELTSLLTASGQASACYSRQFFRYMVGHGEDLKTDDDEMIMRSYNGSVKAGGGMLDMIVDMTKANNFILRR